MKRKTIFLNLSFVLFILILISCATTKISSFTNPNIKISSYQKILVFGNSRDIDFRKTLETDLVNQFTVNGKNVISSINIISPLKEYTQNELNQIYSDNDIDCILSVAVINVFKESAYVPPQTQTNYTSQYVNGELVSIPYTTTTGGYSISYPKASFEIILTDVKTGETALKSTANSVGDEFSDMKTISKSLTKKIVEEYISQP